MGREEYGVRICSSGINGEGELGGRQLANPGSPGKMAVKMEREVFKQSGLYFVSAPTYLQKNKLCCRAFGFRGTLMHL